VKGEHVQGLEPLAARCPQKRSTLFGVERFNLPSRASQNWAAGGALGVAVYNLVSLPELASLAVGGGVGFASGAREAYLELRKGRRGVERKKLFFYYEAGRRLGTA
jgi:hypothetical protein